MTVLHLLGSDAGSGSTPASPAHSGDGGSSASGSRSASPRSGAGSVHSGSQSGIRTNN